MELLKGPAEKQKTEEDLREIEGRKEREILSHR